MTRIKRLNQSTSRGSSSVTFVPFELDETKARAVKQSLPNIQLDFDQNGTHRDSNASAVFKNTKKLARATSLLSMRDRDAINGSRMEVSSAASETYFAQVELHDDQDVKNMEKDVTFSEMQMEDSYRAYLSDANTAPLLSVLYYMLFIVSVVLIDGVMDWSVPKVVVSGFGLVFLGGSYGLFKWNHVFRETYYILFRTVVYSTCFIIILLVRLFDDPGRFPTLNLVVLMLFLVVARSLYLVSLYECMFSCIIFIVINFSYSFSIDGLRATSILLMLCFVIIASIRRGEIQERKSFLIKTKLNKYTINVTSEKERLMRLLSTAYPEYIIESVLKSNIYELPTLACDHATLLVLRVINYHEIMQNCQADEAIIFFGDFFRLISRVVRNCGMTKFRCSNGTYMAIGGITDSSESITVSVVGAAIKIRDSVNATKFVVGNFKVKASIGIHFGKAHTGAVSSAKGSFEVFGDACYVAESALKTGEENAIFVSIPVHERCKKYFEFEPDSVVFDGLEFWKVVHRRHLPLPKVTPKIPVLKRSKKNNLDMMSMIDENYVQASRIGSFIYNVKFHDIRLEDEFQSDFSKRGSENFLRSVAAMTSIFHLLYGIIEVSFFNNHFSFDNGLMVVLVFLRFYIFAPLMMLLACVSYVGDMDWMNVNVMANNATIPYQIHALYGVYTMSKFIYVLVFHLTSLDPIQVNFIVHEVYIWITLQSILPHRLLSRAIFVTVSWIIVVSFSYGYYMYQASFQTLWKTILDIVYLVLIAFSQSLNGYQVAELLLRKQYLLGVQEKETIQKLIAQQELMESILISIIPDHMVTNIRGQDRILERYPDVALILIDIVESRGAVRFLSTRQTFDFFSEVFENIEKMCELYNIVPIKTMGDMYLAMAVKEGEVDDHLARACRMAIETHTHLKNHKFDSWYGTISLRIAVSEGDVIGCVTGRGDLSYEIWGNCVHEAWSILKSTPKDKTRVTDSCAHKLLDSPYIEVETVPMISESGLEEMEKHHYVHVLDSVWGNFIVHTPWMRDDFKGDKLE